MAGFGTTVVAGLVWMFQKVGVLFGSSCLLSLMLVVVFVSSDGSPLLHAQEDENRFWTAVAMVLSSAVFFAADSPFGAIGRRFPTLGCVLVAACGLWISWYDRWLRRRRLSRSLHFSKATSIRGRLDESVDALQKVDDALARLDHLYIPSTITRFFQRRETLRLERLIIETLQDATAEELNALVVHMKLGLVVYKLKDAGRTDLVELLAVQRVADLGVLARVALIDALQQMPLRAHRRAEVWVKNVILWTKSEDLTELKTLMDCKGDIHSFHKLVYVDVQNDAVKAEILRHIGREAKIHAAHHLLATRRARESAARGGDRKVLSDIDDTLLCSGGHYPSGVDRRYPRKAVYPGVCALYRELDLGLASSKNHHHKPSSSSQRHGATSSRSAPAAASLATTTRLHHHETPPPFWKATPPPREEDQETRLHRQDSSDSDDPFAAAADVPTARRLGNLAFLSARPHVYADLAERSSYARFRRLVEERRLHAMPTMLVGDLLSGSEMMVSGDMEPLALKKARNFAEYAALYPEFRFVFLGDNGQGDVRAAELMSDELEHRLKLGRYKLEKAYVHLVQPLEKTHHRHASLQAAEKAWKAANVVFVETFVDAALDAATSTPPLIRPRGLKRVAQTAWRDLQKIDWPPDAESARRKTEAYDALRAAVERANRALVHIFDLPPVDLRELGDDAPVAKTKPSSKVAGPAGVVVGSTTRGGGVLKLESPPASRVRFQLPAPGSAVQTPLGGGILLAVRDDGICEVALDWRLGNRQPAIGFFNTASVNP